MAWARHKTPWTADEDAWLYVHQEQALAKLAKRLGRTETAVEQRIQDRRRRAWGPLAENNERGEPDAEAIRLACLRIQATWSDGERLKRAGLRRVHVEIHLASDFPAIMGGGIKAE